MTFEEWYKKQNKTTGRFVKVGSKDNAPAANTAPQIKPLDTSFLAARQRALETEKKYGGAISKREASTLAEDSGSAEKKKQPYDLKGAEPGKTHRDAGSAHHSGKIDDPSALERVGKTISGGLKASGAGYVNTAGTLAQAAAENNAKLLEADRKAREEAGGSFWDNLILDLAKAPASGSAATDIMLQGARNAGGDMSGVFKAADDLSADSQRDIERAKQGAGEVGKFLVDAGVSGTQMLGDAAINALLPGSGLGAMGVRAFGSAAQTARRRGADTLRQIGYGAAVAGVEMLTEKMFDGLAGVYGAGAADDVIEEFINAAAKTDGGRKLLNVLMSASGEMNEELISGLAERYTDAIITGKLKDLDPSDILYDMAVGGALGGLGGGTQILQESVNKNRATPAPAPSFFDQLVNGLSSSRSASKNRLDQIVDVLLSSRSASENSQVNREISPQNEQFAPAESNYTSEAENAADALTEPLETKPEKSSLDIFLEAAERNNKSGADLLTAVFNDYADNHISPESSVGAAPARFNSAIGEQVETQSKASTDNPYLSEEERAAAAPAPHERITEDMSLERASKLFYFDENGDITNTGDTLSALLERDVWSGEEQDAAQILRTILIDEAVKTGDRSKLNELNKAINERGTEAGRSLQARKKWIDNPDQLISEASEALSASKLSAAEQTEKFNFIASEVAKTKMYGNDVEAWAGALRRASELRRQIGIDGLIKTAIEQGKNDIEWLKRVTNSAIYNVAGDFAKPVTVSQKADKFGKRLKSFFITNQLLRGTTAAANGLSNTISIAGENLAANNPLTFAADAIMSRFTGIRTHKFEKGIFDPNAWKTAADQFNKAQVEIWLDANAGSADSKFNNSHSSGTREYKMTENRVFSVIDAVLGTALNSTDAFFNGLERGSVESSLAPLVKSGKLTAEQAANIAADRGSVTTFHNKTSLGRALSGASKAANLGLEFGAGNILLGNYLNVPSAIATRMISKTPTLGTIGALTDIASVIVDGAKTNGEINDLRNFVTGDKLTIEQRQSRAAQELGRAALGGIEVAAVVALALKGVIRRYDDENKDKKAYEAAQGLSGIVINWSAIQRVAAGQSAAWKVGDKTTNLNRLDPLLVNFNLGIDLADDMADGEEIDFKALKNATLSATEKALADMSYIENIQAFMNAVTYADEDTSSLEAIAQEIITNNATSLVPGAVQQIAKASDPYYRDLYTGESFGENFIDSFKSTIPGLRQTLPVKQTGFGTPKEYTGSNLERVVNALINPLPTGNIKSVGKFNADDFLNELSERTGSSAPYPDRSAPTTTKVDLNSDGYMNDSVRLTAEEKRRYQRKFGEVLEPIIYRISQNNRLTDSEAIDLISEAKSYAREEAKKELARGRGGSYSTKNKHKALQPYL